jgi:hypothetical protein
MVRERYPDDPNGTTIDTREAFEAEETAAHTAIEAHEERFRPYVDGMGEVGDATALEVLAEEHARM